jgi:hypothetical protein
MIRPWRRCAVISLTAIALGGCDLLQDSNARPWIGYAYNKDSGRFEWEWNDWATERDCRESMLGLVETRPGMAKPIGCGYRGNNYLRVWIMNTLWGGTEIGCITKMTKSIEAENGIAYNLKLKSNPDHRGDGWYCV